MLDKNKKGEKVPENYFDQFQNKLKKDILNLKDDVLKNAPLLASYKKEEGYKVPEQYFKNLSTRDYRLTNERSNKNSIRSLYLISSIAACFVLMFSAFFFLQQSPEDNTLAFNEIESNDLYNYLEQNLSDLDNDLLFDISSDLSAEFDNAEGLDYLMDNVEEFDLSDLQDF